MTVATFDLAGARLRIEADEPVRSWLADRLADLAAPAGDAPAALTLTVRHDGAWTVTGAGDQVLPAADAPGAFDLVMAVVNATAADASTGLCLHAGVVARDGRAVVLAGESGSGKSTLTAALVAAGWSYLSDELAPVAGRTVYPFPKPLTLKAGTVALFPRASWPAPAGPERWYLRAAELGGAVGAAAAVGAVVLPQYVPGADELTVCGPTEATLLLASHVHVPQRLDLAAVATLASTVPVAVLELDSLDRARDRVGELWATAPSPTPIVNWVSEHLMHWVAGVGLADGAVLHDTRTGALVALDRLGGAVWRRLASGEPADDVAAALAADADMPTGALLAGVATLAAELTAAGFLADNV